jgi:hypothetical protein
LPSLQPVVSSSPAVWPAVQRHSVTDDHNHYMTTTSKWS